MKALFAVLVLVLSLATAGCVGMVIGAATDAAIEVGKVPFKVGGAVVDVATGGDEEREQQEEE
jgi:hypothetical protein